MICAFCGRENPDDAGFCNECAASLPTHEESDATPLSPDFLHSEDFVGRRPELAELRLALEDIRTRPAKGATFGKAWLEISQNLVD